MPIKITKETNPKYGRITMPVGTYLSNPSTAADGGLGEGGANLPGVQANMWAGVTPGYNTLQTPGSGAPKTPFQAVVRGIGALDQAMKAGANKPLPSDAEIKRIYGDQLGQFLIDYIKPIGQLRANIITPQSTSTTAFASPQANQYIGTETPANPDNIAYSQVEQMFPNMNRQQIEVTMKSKGYQLTWQQGIGETWVKSGESAPLDQLSQAWGLDERGRINASPFEVGPTLENRERKITTGGFGVTGGTEYTNPAGETVSQYAITLPSSAAARNDKHGKYKWTSTVEKDDAGNWVRIYRQELRKVYTRNSQRRRFEARTSQPQTSSDITSGNQLVSLRANYG